VRVLTLGVFLAASLAAVELKQKTLAAFDRYVSQTQAQLDEGRKSGRLLWADRLAPARREELRRGGVLIDSLAGRDARAPDGLIHHWVGAVFIPGASMGQALALVQDYDRHEKVFRPEVIGSKLLRRTGDESEVFLRFFKKKVIAVVLNSNHLVRYHPLDGRRAYARSNMTRVAEVEEAGNPDGPEKPAGQDHGFLWRIFSEWRFEERDGGVYMECESVSLTRDIPIGLGWLVGPFVRSLPRETLANTMTAARDALGGGRAAAHRVQ